MNGKGRGLIGRLAEFRRWLALGMLAAASPLLVSCYGKFPLTKAVYDLNGQVRNDVLRSVVFWVMVIIPVYGVAILADVIVFNLIEFWTGKEISFGSYTDESGNTVEMAPSEDGREALLTVSRDGEVLRQVRFVRVSDELCEVRDLDGRLVGAARRTALGDVCLTDASGRVVSVLDRAEVAGILDSAPGGAEANPGA